MHFSWKRWRVALIAALTALAMSLAFAGQALAAEPGEWGNWNQEMVNDQSMQVASQGTVQEARNGGNLLEVWRGATNDQVWLSFNNGPAFTLGGNTATYVSPTVVAWGTDAFMVFHTGTDGHIYWSPVYNDGTHESYWVQVPDQTTNLPVSVTQIGAGSVNLYIAYRGVGNDTRIWGTLFQWNGGNLQYVYTENIGGGRSPSAPSVVYNSAASALYVAARGLTNNHVWMINGWINDWYSSWLDDGGDAIDSPQIAVNSNGTMLVDSLSSNYVAQYRAYDRWGNGIGDWQTDITNWQSRSPIALAAYGTAIFAIIRGLDNLVWYKQAYNSQ
jgi:hypothetical protein